MHRGACGESIRRLIYLRLTGFETAARWMQFQLRNRNAPVLVRVPSVG
jgi:hypothetical protein